jgi:peptide/nickel transport system ATP-binding protein
LLIADEPTTGLDRELVDALLDKLGRLIADHHAVLLITHDLVAARRVADRIAVMYAGRLVELGPAAEVLARPRHPYTRGLVDALPDGAFTAIPGQPPLLTDLPARRVVISHDTVLLDRWVDRALRLTSTGRIQPV